MKSPQDAVPDRVSDQASVRDHLDRVLASETFARSDRLIRLLRFVVEETLAGRTVGLKESLIGVFVYDRPDFDPRLDSSVRVDARRLRLKLDEYYAGPGARDPVRIVLSKGSYVPAFEMGQRAASPTGRARSLPRWWALRWSGAAAGLVLVVACSWWWTSRQPARPASPPATDIQVENLSKQAAFLLERRNEESLHDAIALGEEALRRDPSHAPAHAALAEANFLLAALHRGQYAKSLVDTSTAHARRALELNPSLGGPLATLGIIRLSYERDYKEAEVLLAKAVRVNPDHALARVRYSTLLSILGRHEEALEQARRSEALAPLSLSAQSVYGFACYLARRYDDAIAHLRAAAALDPSFDGPRFTIVRACELSGRKGQARDELSRIREAARQSPEYHALSAWLLARSGRRDAARKEMAASDGAVAMTAAAAWAEIGDLERAFQVLDERVRDNDPSLVYAAVSPGLDPLRSDPRFAALCRSLRLHACAGSPAR